MHDNQEKENKILNRLPSQEYLSKILSRNLLQEYLFSRSHEGFQQLKYCVIQIERLNQESL